MKTKCQECGKQLKAEKEAHIMPGGIHCKPCAAKIRKREIKAKYICSCCRKPYIDCWC
jgi:DNA-directed RNA polymerase subunit RPC12/RpoP